MELAPAWEAHRSSDRQQRRGHPGSRGGGRRYDLSFPDRVVAALAVLRHSFTHEVLAHLFSVSRSTIDRAVKEVRPLLAARGCEVEEGVCLSSLADVFAYLAATGKVGRIDGTDIRVRRPPAGRPGRRRFVSGKHRLNTLKATTISDEDGNLLWVGAWRPGRMHDQTAIVSEGIDDLLTQHPNVHLLVDAGYLGLAKRHPGQVQPPPPKPAKDAPPDVLEVFAVARHAQSSARIPVEHVNAHLKIPPALARWRGRREHLPEAANAWAAVLTYRRRQPDT